MFAWIAMSCLLFLVVHVTLERSRPGVPLRGDALTSLQPRPVRFMKIRYGRCVASPSVDAGVNHTGRHLDGNRAAIPPLRSPGSRKRTSNMKSNSDAKVGEKRNDLFFGHLTHSRARAAPCAREIISDVKFRSELSAATNAETAARTAHSVGTSGKRYSKETMWTTTKRRQQSCVAGNCFSAACPRGLDTESRRPSGR